MLTSILYYFVLAIWKNKMLIQFFKKVLKITFAIYSIFIVFRLLCISPTDSEKHQQVLYKEHHPARLLWYQKTRHCHQKEWVSPRGRITIIEDNGEIPTPQELHTKWKCWNPHPPPLLLIMPTWGVYKVRLFPNAGIKTAPWKIAGYFFFKISSQSYCWFEYSFWTAPAA